MTQLNEFTIGGRTVNENSTPFVIAEAGINHEGDYDKAIALVDAATASGADCIKFQSHITEEEMIPTDMKPGDISNERLWDIIKRCELSSDEELKLQQHCAIRGIVYLSTPFSRAAADRLAGMRVPAFKIGSGECNNYPLVDYIARMGKPIILSTGMNDLASVAKSVEIIRSHGCPLVLMHCTSMYPTPYDKVRLNAMIELKTAFNVPVGLSDHSKGIYTCLGAVALGACVLEKHFTVSHDWPGPDIPVSIDPAELKQMVIGAKAIWQARGGAKTILPEERPVIDFAYATVVTIKPIKADDVFSRENIWVKRPGTGKIFARDFESLLGKRAARDLPAHIHVSPDDVTS
jgi:N-acetylneuraminate synthase